MKRAVHRLVRINYGIRAGAFAWSFFVVCLYAWERDFGPFFWVLAVWQFLVYPHVAFWRAKGARSAKRAELDNLYLDALFLGGWMAGFGFPTWAVYAALHSTSLNAIVLRGLRGLGTSVAAFFIGALLIVGVNGLEYQPETSELITALCFFGSLGYTCAIGYVQFVTNRHLVSAREARRLSETRYRLITENAADLVALVDPDGRWLYGSPSYQRLLGEDAVSLGGDAFTRAHPDDAQEAHNAVRRVSITGKPRDLVLRFIDRDGRVRQFRSHVQALDPEATAPGLPHHRVLLVSQDITDLKESEERLLVAAHALEGMTEGILITSADGTVVAVNHAFTQLTGFSRDDVLGRPVREFRNGLQSADFYDEIFLSVLRKGFWTGTVWSKRKNGSVYREWRSVRAVKDLEGAVSHYVMVFFEVQATAQDGASGAASPS